MIFGIRNKCQFTNHDFDHLVSAVTGNNVFLISCLLILAEDGRGEVRSDDKIYRPLNRR